jgi:hypothetical protein
VSEFEIYFFNELLLIRVHPSTMVEASIEEEAEDVGLEVSLLNR